jgi:hypothetical protein
MGWQGIINAYYVMKLKQPSIFLFIVKYQYVYEIGLLVIIIFNSIATQYKIYG